MKRDLIAMASMKRPLLRLLIAALLSACASKPDEAPERTEA